MGRKLRVTLEILILLVILGVIAAYDKRGPAIPDGQLVSVLTDTLSILGISIIVIASVRGLASVRRRACHASSPDEPHEPRIPRA